MGISLSTTLHASFDDAAQRTREALATQGFGVLTEIDVKAGDVKKTSLKTSLAKTSRTTSSLVRVTRNSPTKRSMSTDRWDC